MVNQPNTSLVMKKFPKALVIMIGFILFAAILTYIIPQGEYQRVLNPETNQLVVVNDSYQEIDAPSVSLWDTFMSLPEGFINREDLIAII